MEINFNVHGPQRKKLVDQIANYTQQKAEYQYTPTYAYQIGKYTVSKDGNLSSPDEIPSNLIDKLKELGFRPANIIKLHLAYRRDDFTDQALEKPASPNLGQGTTNQRCLSARFAKTRR